MAVVVVVVVVMVVVMRVRIGRVRHKELGDGAVGEPGGGQQPSFQSRGAAHRTQVVARAVEEVPALL